MALITSISQEPYQMAFSCTLTCHHSGSLPLVQWPSTVNPHGVTQSCRLSGQTLSSLSREKKNFILWLSTQSLFHEAIIHSWKAGFYPKALMDSVENSWGRLSKQISGFSPLRIASILAHRRSHTLSHVLPRLQKKCVLANSNKQRISTLDSPG